MYLSITSLSSFDRLYKWLDEKGAPGSKLISQSTVVRGQGQHLLLAEDLHDKLWKLFRSHRKVNTLLVSPTGDTPAKVRVSSRKTEQGAIQGLGWYRCLKLFQLDFLPAVPPTDPASLLQPPNPEPVEGAHHPQMLTSGNKSKKEKRRVRCRRW